MKDIPPNPEDGELWLPSDVFHEIVSSNLTSTTSATPPPTPKNNNNNNNNIKNNSNININNNRGAGNTTTDHGAPHFLLHQPYIYSPLTPIPSPYAPPPIFHQVVFPIGSIGNGVLIVNNHYYSYASWNGVFHLFPAYVHFFYPFAPTQFQAIVGWPNWALQGARAKCKGTGVFLPKKPNHKQPQQQQQAEAQKSQKSENKNVVNNNHQKLEQPRGGGPGTGAFLKQQVHVISAPARKKKKRVTKLAS